MDSDARARLERFRDAGGRVESDEEQKLLDALLWQSPYLSALLIREPSQLQSLANDPHLRREKPREVMRAEITALHGYRNREYLRLGARELGWGEPESVARELSHLADTCLDFVIGGQPGFVVIGMGKLGGEELNFSSDIDLIYVCADDAAHEAATRLAERVTRAIGEVTDEGLVFRVDLRLRPEGSRGPLVNSLDALERYYEAFGRPWERQAWLKARPVAGDLALGAEVMKRLEPFIWPRTSGEDVIGAVHALMARIRAELADPDDVKLGPGGIREVEFFVQALQMVHARDPSLRERGTLRALDKLLFAGLVSEKEHRALGEAYLFLRRVEHRLQLEQGLKTHLLPRDRQKLAARLGYLDERAFEIALETHRRTVSEIYATLGEPVPPDDVLGLLDPLNPPTAEMLSALGFSSLDELERLRNRPQAPILPLLLHEAARSPDPDLALRRLVDLRPSIFPLVEAHRPLATLLMSLLGTSEFLGKQLVDHPDLVAELLAQKIPLADKLVDLPVDLEARLNALRRVKNEELLRIGLYDIAGELSPDEVSFQLSELADAMIRAVTPPDLAVLALGKLGACELTYASDLDLIFVFAGDDFDLHARQAQRLIHALSAHLDEGRLYQVDTRLRPSGQQGTLVSSLEAFRDYHAHHAHLWERQALIKLRFVAGDARLGREVETLAAEHVWSGPVDAAEISRMRARIERELARETPDRFHLKAGRGGLYDIEFLTQYLQLRDGRARARSTSQALRELRDLGALANEEATVLLESHTFLRRLESRLRLIHDRAIDALVPSDLVARRLGYRGESPGARLLGDYRAHTERVRALYQRYLP